MGAGHLAHRRNRTNPAHALHLRVPAGRVAHRARHDTVHRYRDRQQRLVKVAPEPAERRLEPDETRTRGGYPCRATAVDRVRDRHDACCDECGGTSGGPSDGTVRVPRVPGGATVWELR